MRRRTIRVIQRCATSHILNWVCGEMNAEAVNNRAKLLMHRIIARHLRKTPELIVKATAWLDWLGSGPEYQCYEEWRDLLQQDIETISRLIISRDERMTRLRLSSPLVNIVDLRDPNLRRRIWQLAKKGKA